MSEITFYNKFIDEKNRTTVETEVDNKLKVEKFLEHFLKKHKINYDSIIMLSNGLQNYINKPQRILEDNPNNYVAIDMHTNIYYICFKDLIMIDIDIENNNNNSFFKRIKKDFLVNKFKKYDDVFYLDETLNGFHIFILNKRIDHKKEEVINYMIDFECDIKYIICCYLRGFSIRLNKKNIFDKMYKHCDIYGNKNLIDKSIIEDIDKINFLVNKYDDILKY